VPHFLRLEFILNLANVDFDSGTKIVFSLSITHVRWEINTLSYRPCQCDPTNHIAELRMSRKKRIALFTTDIFGGGPSGKKIPVLVDLFSRLSVHFHIEVYSLVSVTSTQLPGYIPVIQPPAMKLPGRLKFLIVAMKFIINQFFHRSDLIFAVSDYPAGHWAIRLGKLFKQPVVVQLIGFEAVALPEIDYGNLTIPWLTPITRSVCEKADDLIVVAEYQKSVARQCLPTEREMIVLPLRIDPEKFPFHRHHISYPVQFIHVAYYSALKDQDMMFTAFAKVAASVDCHLTVVGDFYDVPKVHALLHELGITEKITFTGVIAQSELPPLFQRAHILLHTARFETGCAAIQEAMASGVAVCGTNVGILADIGNDYAVTGPVGDAMFFAAKILELIHDPIAYEAMTDRAYEFIVVHGAEWSYLNYLHFLEMKLTQKDPE
jgi:glycosyltransferase involved in cell wall biosynthesis